jgi:hypothetical protein
MPAVLFDIAVDDLDETHLAALVGKAREGDHLDAKRATYQPGFNHEFLKDAAAFANYQGGHLLIGAEEKNGLLTGFPGFQGNVDAEMRRLHQIAQSGLDKPILGLRIEPVPLAGGGHVIVVRVPPSFIGAHQIVSAGSQQCDHQYRIVLRAGSGIVDARPEQIAEIAERGPKRIERADKLRAARVAAIAGGHTLCKLKSADALVVQLVPLGSFESAAIPLPRLDAEKARISPLTLGGCDFSVNGGGLLAYVNPTADVCTAYVQLYRTGVYESVRCGVRFLPPTAKIDRVNAREIEQDVLAATINGINVLRALNVSPPYVVYASLVGIGGAVYVPVDDFATARRLPDQVLAARVMLPEIALERRLPIELLPAFDEIANEGGHVRSPTAQRASY